MPDSTTSGEGRLRWTLLLNAVVIALSSLPLVIAYPAVFARLGIVTLENGFFVQLAGAWLFTEAVASFLAWRGARPNRDLVLVIIAMKVVFIALVAVAAGDGTLPSPGLYPAAVFDIVMCLVFGLYLRGVEPSH
ncbi:MAG: hypothetical protein U0031_04480 [Thermomicrobiales bacterium]